jgi:hypothetical protein
MDKKISLALYDPFQKRKNLVRILELYDPFKKMKDLD